IKSREHVRQRGTARVVHVQSELLERYAPFELLQKASHLLGSGDADSVTDRDFEDAHFQIGFDQLHHALPAHFALVRTTERHAQVAAHAALGLARELKDRAETLETYRDRTEDVHLRKARGARTDHGHSYDGRGERV